MSGLNSYSMNAVLRRVNCKMYPTANNFEEDVS